MSVIASCLYRQGARVADVPIAEAKIPEAEDEFIWIGLSEPTPEELHALEAPFDLHPLAIGDALASDQMPKIDVYGDQLFVVTRTAVLNDDQIEYGQTAIFIGARHIITVRQGSGRGHAGLRAQLEQAPRLLRHGSDYVLHAILDFVVDNYIPIARTIEDTVLSLERQVIDAFLERAQIVRLFGLRREVILFQRIVAPMVELTSKLANLELPAIDPEARPYFSDVLDHARRVEAQLGSLKDLITSVFEASNLLESQRQGTVTKNLAAWAAILAVPTAIAGIYGMNFENMPELKARYGYFIVLGAIGVICVLLYRRFKKVGWL